MSVRQIHRYRSRNTRNTFLLALLVIGLMLAFVYGQKRGEAFTCKTDAPHVATYGDTLWSIAETYCEGNIQHATDKLVDAYGHPGSLQLGTRIYLPSNQSCDLTVIDGQVYEDCK